MEPYTVEYYKEINKLEKIQAEELAKILIDLYHPRSVIDIGCATGIYMKPFVERGIPTMGFDYSEEAFDPEVIQVDRKTVWKKDLRVLEPMPLVSDLGICLEVVEHIGNEHVETVVDNLCSCADTLVITAAPPGQAGLNHVTLEPQAYWQEKFEKRGFKRDFHDEYQIVSKIDAFNHHVWIIRNLMVFKK